MAKKQTRKSVSLSASVYQAASEIAHDNGLNTTAYVTQLIQADLKLQGRFVPTVKHCRDGKIHLPIEDLAIPELVATAALESQGPIVLAENCDPKYLKALEFTRNRLANGETDKPSRKVCFWCDESFKPGAPVEEYDHQKMHPACHKQVVKFNG